MWEGMCGWDIDERRCEERRLKGKPSETGRGGGMEDLRIAILGVGWAGAKHVEAIRELGCGLVVDCLVDHDPTFLATQCSELGVEKSYIYLWTSQWLL